MPAFTATAPGKIILFGEHAVVYHRPAVAVPVNQVQARAVVLPDPRAPRGRVWIQAPDIQVDSPLDELPESAPLARLVHIFLEHFSIDHLPACTLRVSSTIPIAAGMGSGAAISVACLRALAAFIGSSLPPEQVSALAFEIEKMYHGTPSGIDNTVVTFGQPVFFVRDQPIEILSLDKPFMLVIGDTGVRSPTSGPVEAVRRAWKADPGRYEALFDQAGEIARSARNLLESGDPARLGSLMNANQQLLVEMGVSSPELDHLVQAAQDAGALGAKLSGAGWGGNMIALVDPGRAEQVSAALHQHGAVNTLITRVG
ncbi:MAG TPA: mevalonate kinase [Anaerolineales bacterium]|nr:mevalonate kinase [Anaerolineales bacterium]